MTRAPSALTSLVKAGFANLSESRGRLEDLGYEASDFSSAADPDLADLVIWLDIAGELRRYVTSHIKIDLCFALHFTFD